jgi:hypothetical protein
MQYTLRNIPDYVDAALRRTAQEQRKSLNEVAIQALVQGAGLSENPRPRRNLADIAGSWREDPAFDAALAAQQKVDEELWPKQPVGLKRARKRRAA